MAGLSRRLLLKKSLYTSAGVLLGAVPAVSQNETEEARKKALAKYHFQFNSPYFTSHYQTTPHAHQEIKETIEKTTQSKVYVTIHDGGVNGIGSQLVSGVRFGKYQGALLSVSNLAPQIKELDILNIPFWSASDQDYNRLVHSLIWRNSIVSQAEQYKLKILFHYMVGARTASTIKHYNETIKTPADFKGVTFRVPGSKSLKQFYELTKAIPMSIPWGLCAATARQGRFQALDPSVIGLYSGPDNLNQEIASISKIQSVHDGWIAIGNTDFINSLDAKTRAQFLDSFEVIEKMQFERYQNAEKFCEDGFIRLGTSIYNPTQQEIAQLAKAFGHENPAWDSVKKRLLGDQGMQVFDQLYRAAKG